MVIPCPEDLPLYVQISFKGITAATVISNIGVALLAIGATTVERRRDRQWVEDIINVCVAGCIGFGMALRLNECLNPNRSTKEVALGIQWAGCISGVGTVAGSGAATIFSRYRPDRAAWLSSCFVLFLAIAGASAGCARTSFLMHMEHLDDCVMPVEVDAPVFTHTCPEINAKVARTGVKVCYMGCASGAAFSLAAVILHWDSEFRWLATVVSVLLAILVLIVGCFSGKNLQDGLFEARGVEVHLAAAVQSTGFSCGMSYAIAGAAFCAILFLKRRQTPRQPLADDLTGWLALAFATGLTITVIAYGVCLVVIQKWSGRTLHLQCKEMHREKEDMDFQNNPVAFAWIWLLAGVIAFSLTARELIKAWPWKPYAARETRSSIELADSSLRKLQPAADGDLDAKESTSLEIPRRQSG